MVMIVADDAKVIARYIVAGLGIFLAAQLIPGVPPTSSSHVLETVEFGGQIVRINMPLGRSEDFAILEICRIVALIGALDVVVPVVVTVRVLNSGPYVNWIRPTDRIGR